MRVTGESFLTRHFSSNNFSFYAFLFNFAESIVTAADSSCTCIPDETSINGEATKASTNGESNHSRHHTGSHEHSHHHHNHHSHRHSHDSEHTQSQHQKGHQQHYLDTRVTHTHRSSHSSQTTTTAAFKSPHKDPAKHTPTRKSYSSPPGIPYNSSEDPEFADWNHRSVSASAVIGLVDTTAGINSHNGNSHIGKSTLSRTLSDVNVASANTTRKN